MDLEGQPGKFRGEDLRALLPVSFAHQMDWLSLRDPHPAKYALRQDHA